MNLGAKTNYFNHKKLQESLGPEREMRSLLDFRDLAKMECISWDASYGIKSIANWVSEHYGPKFSPMTKVTRFISIYCF
jgi:hypothetical protein